MVTIRSAPNQTLDVGQTAELARALRVNSIRASAAAGSGHPTSSMSAADLMAVLLAQYLKYDFEQPEDPRNDHLIFSKGHASPLLYAMFHAAGAMSDEELLTFRRLGSRVQGHPTPALPWVDVATGSLGQGLPIGVGIALAGRRLDRLPYRVWVLCGDGEMAEGSMWEALEHAGFWGLGNLTAIVDVNRFGQSGETMHEWDLSRYSERARACGWNAIEIDGHDLREISEAYREAIRIDDRPTLVVARTVKGKGVAAVANVPGAHGRVLDDPQGAIEELGGAEPVRVDVQRPDSGTAYAFPVAPAGDGRVRYERGKSVATRRAYGDALAALGSIRGDIVVMDGETKNSTYAEIFATQHPDRYFEMYIAEQQMVAAAVGMQVRGWVPYASTFAAFFARAYDFIRMAAISRANIRLIGSHAGVSIGEDGPSQMGLEDIACLRAVFGSTVLYPCDANQTARLVESMADREGVVYLRTTREATAILYGPDEEFPIGGSRVLRESDEDRVTIIGAGITVHEALAAADALAAESISARVIDLYSVKPIDEATLREAARVTGRLLTVEDHWAEGGVGSAVADVFAGERDAPVVRRLAVRTMPGSGPPSALRSEAGIDAAHIVEAARNLVREF